MKKVGCCMYFHKSNIREMAILLDDETKSRLTEAAKWMNEHDKPFEVIKVNSKTQDITLLNAIDWNERYEPIVGDSIKFSLDGKIRGLKGGYAVYHQKHLFVSDDYTGFDLFASYNRTLKLETLYKVKHFKKKIGSVKYWNEILEFYQLPVYM